MMPELAQANDGVCLLYRPPVGPAFCCGPVSHSSDAFHLPGESFTLQLAWRLTKLANRRKAWVFLWRYGCEWLSARVQGSELRISGHQHVLFGLVGLVNSFNSRHQAHGLRRSPCR